MNILLLLLSAILCTIQPPAAPSRQNTLPVCPISCRADQALTVFRDGALFQDGENIIHVRPDGRTVWSFHAGSNVNVAVSDSLIAVWKAKELTVLNQDGMIVMEAQTDAPIQFARPGEKSICVVSGDEWAPVVSVWQTDGTPLRTCDTDFDGLVILHGGWSGPEDSLLWMVSLDFFQPSVHTCIHLFPQDLSDPVVIPIDNLVSGQIRCSNGLLHVATSQERLIFDVNHPEEAPQRLPLYGWQCMGVQEHPDAMLNALLVPLGEAAFSTVRLQSIAADRQLELPAPCIAAAFVDGRILAISGDALHICAADSDHFRTYPILIPDGSKITGLIGATASGSLFVQADAAVYAIQIPQ